MDRLIVDDDEALSLARELADRRGTSVDEAVIASLRTAVRQTPPRERSQKQIVRVPALNDLTPEQRARYEANRAWVRQIAQYRVPGGTSDHGDLYDKNGLPA